MKNEAFDIVQLAREFHITYPGYDRTKDYFLETAAQLEATGVFTKVSPDAQLRDIVDWLGTAGYRIDHSGTVLDTMYRAWKGETQHSDFNDYEKMTAAFLQERGTPVKLFDDYYGWEDFGVEDELKSSQIIAIEDIGVDSWQQFEGTFYEGDATRSGLIAYITTDTGLERYVRYEGDLADVFKYYAEH